MLYHVISHVTAFLCSVITAAILLKGLLYIYRKNNDDSKARARDGRLVPQIGGMVFLPAMAIGVVAVMIMGLIYGSLSETLRTSSVIIAVGIFFVYILGIVNDLLDTKRWQRNVIIIVASCAFPLVGLYVNDLHGFLGLHHIGIVAGFFITFVATLLIVKGLEELSDIDGLSATLGLLALLTFGCLFAVMGRHIYATMAFALAGAVLVFLRYSLFGDEKLGNKVGMGHAGVLTLGFCLVYLALKYAMDNSLVMDRHADAILLPYSLFALPMFEFIRVWVTSSWQGLTPEQRASRHIQKIIFDKGFSPLQTVGIILLGEMVIIAMNLLLHHLCNVNITWIVVMNIIVYIVLLNIASERIEAPHAKATNIDVDFHDYVGREGLVSIVMPTYNSADFVAESIESILAQTYTNWELIVTDDCSTDNTMAILRSYAERDPRIVIQSNEVNGGAGVSRNRSIAAARGQYISFCDSDDRWLPKKLELQLAFMREKDVALCFAPYYTCDENSQYLGYISAPRRVSLFETMCDNKIGFLTCIYDTRLVGKHLMPSQRKRQDHGLLLTLLKVCNYAYSVPQPLAFYRIRPDNLSARKISLVKYNAQTYTAVFGWPKAASYAFLFTIFLPTYFAKRLKNIVINAVRSV